jgi:proteasome accessory factor B
MLQSGRSYTPDELSQELEVSRRTVFRDLNMLELAGVPYYFDQERNTYRICQHFFLPPVNLTLGEALTMLVLARHLGRTDKLPLLTDGSRAAAKLQSVLPEAIRRHVGDVLEHVNVSLLPMARHDGLDGVFDRLTGAVVGRRACRMRYDSLHDGRELDITVHPLRVTFHGRAWYLLAFSPTHGEVRTFKLARIRELSVLDDVFVPPADVRLEQPFGQAWSMIPEGRLYDVHLRFEPKVATNVAEVQWHPSQRTTANADGTLDFRVRVDGLGEIRWWILGYGDQVQVLAPPQLRQQVAQVARSMAARYAEGD